MPDRPVYVFDAYGTLFDVHSAAAQHRDLVGPQWERLSEVWRTKQLEYTWVHGLAGRPATFWELTTAALDVAAAATVGHLSAEARDKLLAAYRTLDAYPEVAEVLRHIRESGFRSAILSNGDPDLLETAVASAGLSGLFDAVLSVASAGVFKPSMTVYALAADRFGVAPGAITFVSSNRWDVAGGKAFGYRCVWVNRRGAPDEYAALAPDRIIPDLTSLVGGPQAIETAQNRKP